MGRPTGLKKAPAIGAFFLFWTLSDAIAGQPACAVDRVDETVQVRRVFDGDTVQLDDGRRVRLLGINTPEIDHDNGSDEPLARQARQALVQILARAKQVGLRLGRRQHDHYGRLLAHVIIDGDRDVQQMLLARGLAMAIVIAPDLWHLDCYQDAENQARQRHKGVWGQEYYRPLDVDQSRPQRAGFRLLHGTIRHVGLTDASVWFDFEHGVSLRLASANRAYFHDQRWQGWRGRRVEARGWLYEIHHDDGSAWQMNIYHPQSLRPVTGADQVPTAAAGQ